MKLRCKLGTLLCGVVLSAAFVSPSLGAQRGNQAPKQQQQPQSRPAQRADRPPQRNERPAYHPQTAPRRGNESRAPQAGNRTENRPPAYDNRRSTNDNRPNANQGRSVDRPNFVNRQPGQNPQDRLRNMAPADRQRLAQREEQFRHLPPSQQQQLRDSARVWERMTPAQRDHIRNEIVPKWKQMPPERQRAIQHRLGVLQNMPEDARNRHLNDPNFTRGMSEEDKDMLRDLAHQHVAGSPAPPNE